MGSGRSPVIPVADRPAGLTYVGLDISHEELRRAPEGSYDDAVACDVAAFQARLEERFDLIVSWQVFEHVRPLSTAVEVLRRYLRPGGRLVAQLSGRWAAFAVLNRLVPTEFGVEWMRRRLGRDPSTVFHAYYDGCTASSLEVMVRTWATVDVVPRYRGATYFDPLPPVRRLYLAYENWAAQSAYRDLATHYLINAER